MKYSAVIFDLDGTILNTLGDLAAATNHALAANKLPLRTTDEVRRFVGNGIQKLIERAVPEGTDSAVIASVHESFTKYYGKHCIDETKPYDNIPELLSFLRDSDCRTAVVSNKDDYAVQTLCRVFFPAQFNAVVGVTPDIKPKPSPDTVNEVLRRLGVTKEQCVFVGDSEVDIQTAQNAGMPCISVSWGFKGRQFLEEHDAQRIADTIPDLMQALN